MKHFVNLALKCPACGKMLVDENTLVDEVPSIKLMISIGDREGYIWLSSIYGSYNLQSDIDIEDESIATLTCPHCLADLRSSGECSECKAPLVDFHLIEGGKVSICSRAGCKKHSIEFEDIGTALNHFYNEFEVQKLPTGSGSDAKSEG
ncbi:MAG: hypothetical protein Q8M98_05590 [Candidatus Cloacimonadaceae bacterium]|nr:hypothetical protein [Candidatus Cloacimonadaceae bacterium]MDP3114234.1 hypothetical protein [Candidatus Cloacimonadaceae bacterium]